MKDRIEKFKKIVEFKEKIELLDWMDDYLTKRMKYCAPDIKEIYLEAIEENKRIRVKLKRRLQ